MKLTQDQLFKLISNIQSTLPKTQCISAYPNSKNVATLICQTMLIISSELQLQTATPPLITAS